MSRERTTAEGGAGAPCNGGATPRRGGVRALRSWASASAARSPAGPLGQRSGAPAPRSGDATVANCRQPPTMGSVVLYRNFGGGAA